MKTLEWGRVIERALGATNFKSGGQGFESLPARHKIRVFLHFVGSLRSCVSIMSANPDRDFFPPHRAIRKLGGSPGPSREVFALPPKAILSCLKNVGGCA